MKDIPQKSKESPALAFRSVGYPEEWNGRVPLKVRMMRTVYSEIPCIEAFVSMRYAALVNETYYAWVNSHGAVSAVMDDGECLGLKPGEFAIVEWWPETDPDG